MTSDERRRRALEQIAPFADRARTFSGWNFDDLRVTNLDPPPAWDYVAIASEHAARVGRVIDLGTGGGEVYARIVAAVAARIDARFVASEEWHVNAPVARDRLRPLAVEVVHASSEVTPWAAASFDLVLSRHEAIVPEEIVRILRPGGVFMTQQVGIGQWEELRAFFPRKTIFPDHYALYRHAFEAAGMDVTSQTHDWRAAYGGLGEIAYMLLVAPWEVPDFNPEAEIDALLALEDAHGGEEGIVLTLSRYLMIARKPPDGAVR
jgi:SAM-dependent methyltransferase